MSLILPFFTALGAYYMIGYWMMSGTHNREPSNERIFVAIQLYIIGVVFMLLTDAQKYLVLRERRGLITHCMNGWSRNMNYLGEMMLYSSFAVLCQRNEPWYFYAVIWSVLFSLRMLTKEYSLSKKEGWPEYKRNSWPLLPKLGSNTFLSMVIYSVFFGGLFYCYSQGGFEKTAKLWLDM